MQWVFEAVVLFWLSGVTFLLWRNRVFLQKLFPAQGKSFKDKLAEILEATKKVGEFEDRNLSNIQKVALKRYNPYHDTGGDQSFSVALLDGRDNGMVITSLHSRAGTRVFAKPVKSGKEGQFQLSQEEREVVNQAISYVEHL